MATKFYLPNLLEFIYGFILSKGRNTLFNLLDKDDFRKIKDESTVRKFAQYENIEDKMIMLSKMGMGAALVFWDKEKQHKKRVEDIVIAYIDTDPNDLARTLVKDYVYVARDIDLIKSLQTMSHASNGRGYSINRRFLSIRARSISTKILSDKIEAEKNLQWYSETVLFALEIEPYLEQYDISLIDYKILLNLHSAPNGVTLNYLVKKLRRSNITGIVNRLYKKNMLCFHLENENVVLIDVYGITVLQQIFNKFP